MGDYTKLKFDAVLNEEGLEVIQFLLELRNNEGSESWSEWEKAAEKWPEKEYLQIWNEVGRKNFIPFGWSAYHDWEQPTLVENVWSVCCSIKNYNQEIQTFISKVLPSLIKESCMCLVETEYCYEYGGGPDNILIKPITRRGVTT
jgi:hypothetical protein